MRLLEHEAKRLFAEYDISIPKSRLISNADEARNAVNALRSPAVVKAQIPVGGRGKAGAIGIVDDAEEAFEQASRILGSKFHGYKPSTILIEEFLEHEDEYYASMILSRPQRRFVALASASGGVDVEALAEEGLMLEEQIHPAVGLMDFQSRRLAMKTAPQNWKGMQRIIHRLYRLMVDKDLQLVEINPLARKEGGFIALDAKITVDDNAIFRQPFAKETAAATTFADRAQKIGQEQGIAFVPLEGDVAVIGNGAGLVMATLDLVAVYGGEPACFVDVGGGASSQVMATAIRAVQEEIRPKSNFINIFGGITRCDEIANGMVEAVSKLGSVESMNLVVRLTGTNEEEGQRILKEAGVHAVTSMEEAAEKAVELAEK